jgi:putative nucleotidyltransferase with HDIG domain
MQNLLLNTVETLQGEIYLVGGSVRDTMLGLPVKDADYIVTGIDFSTLRTHLETWARVDVVGASFGVLKVTHNDLTVDVALPRTERSTGIHHRDFEVTFDPSLPVEADLARRDFTVNAMAVRLRDQTLIDPFNGKTDLEQKKLCAVGEASERFSEDPLRMLRLARFVAKLGFTVDAQTLNATRVMANLVPSVAPERIQNELLGLLACKNNLLPALQLLRDTGLLEQIMPEYAVSFGFDQQNPHHHLSLDEHMFQTVVFAAQSSAEVKLAALLHDIGKPATQVFGDDGVAHYYHHEAQGADITRTILQRLKCSTELLEMVVKLVRNHMRPPIPSSQKALRKFVNDLGVHATPALELRRADRLAHTPEPNWNADEWLKETLQRCADFPSNLETFDERELAVSGLELIDRFNLVGASIGAAKKAAANAIIEGELENEKAAIFAWFEMNGF